MLNAFLARTRSIPGVRSKQIHIDNVLLKRLESGLKKDGILHSIEVLELTRSVIARNLR
jgi:hypothetical protein